ncbi:MAG: hypothetical protein ACR2PX_03650 [Endozoicomonas sp.]|uniref:hypothetical protein n=1 Tax=Endozoicomonas sp. TaxID=1892382 RepID=UPI003D9AF045
MAYPVRHSSQFKLFMVAVLAFMLVTPKPAEANNGRLYTAAGLTVFVIFTGGTVWYNHASPEEDPEFTDDGDTQEHTLQLPVINYKREAELKNHHHPSDIRLAPMVDAKSSIIELKGTRSKLRAKTKAVICEPILKVKGVNQTLLKDINDQCHNWFIKHRMVFPHEFSGIDLKKVVNAVLPELVYSSNSLTLMPYQTALKSGSETKGPALDMNYYHITMAGFETSQLFKTCYHYPKASGMVPPMMDSSGKLVFQLPKQGVTHLHHDGHAEFFIATDISNNQTKAYFWRLGSPWPTPPTSVRLSTATGELQTIHVPTHE